MRVLAITTLYPRPGRELIAAFNRQQHRELVKEHELRVVAPVAWVEKLKDAARRKAAPAHYSNSDDIVVDHPTYYYLPRVAPHRLGEWYLWSVAEAVRRVAREFRPDVLLACWAHPDGWAAAQLGRELRLPVVLKVIGSDLLVATRDRKRRERVAETLRAVDRVVPVSEHLAEAAVRLGAPAEKVSVVREGVDTELFSPGDRMAARERLGIVAPALRDVGSPPTIVAPALRDRGSPPGTVGATEKIVLFVGNVLLSKGAGVLVEAIKKAEGRRQKAEEEASGVRRQASGEEEAASADGAILDSPGRNPGEVIANCKLTEPPTPNPQPLTPLLLRCFLVGSGRDEAKVRRLIAKHGLEECVKLVGTCPHEKLVDWYRACDVVALPSFSEGVPNVLQEALACGRPFVATHVGGIPEIAHPSYSRLVSPGDARELADALEEMLGGCDAGKGDRNLLCEAPSGPFRQKVPVPFSAPFHVDPALVAERTISWQRSAELLAEVLEDAVRRRVGTAHQGTETAKTLLAER